MRAMMPLKLGLLLAALLVLAGVAHGADPFIRVDEDGEHSNK
jgi:hypothetical protein